MLLLACCRARGSTAEGVLGLNISHLVFCGSGTKQGDGVSGEKKPEGNFFSLKSRLLNCVMFAVVLSTCS